MKHTNWVHTIIRALDRLGGSAPYARLKPEIQASGEREFSGKWRQTVEGTVEQFSSDSIRGHKPPGFKNGPRDVFRQIGRGHWAIRTYDNVYVREALLEALAAPDSHFVESDKVVYVREHWRRLPGIAESLSTIEFDLQHFAIVAVLVTDEHVAVEFSNGLLTNSPLSWFPKLAASNPSDRSNLSIAPSSVHWPDLGCAISVAALLGARE